MGKKHTYTKITPLPQSVPRQLALELLHSHAEVIKLNPLVTGVDAMDAPRDAPADEYYSQWYTITEIITWGFGLKKKIAFNGCFHDQPWGLQTHVYAPMGVDIRQKFRIGGNQPGEPREARELGIDTPVDGLYLREDVEITCAVPLTANFVKKETKAATGTMIERLAKKAELLDEGKLHAMFENGRLKTAKPSTNATYADRPIQSPTSSRVSSPSASYASPTVDEKGFGRYHDIVQTRPSAASHRLDNQPVFEMAGSTQYVQHEGIGLYTKTPDQQIRAELAGDDNALPGPGPYAAQPAPTAYSYQKPGGGLRSGPYEADGQGIGAYSIQPDHQRFSRSNVPAVPSSKCPMCNAFEGDAAAVTHHVNQQHMSA